MSKYNEQLQREYRYSRKNIRLELISIMDEDASLFELYKELCAGIEKYLSKIDEYHETKRERITMLFLNNRTEDIALELLLVCLPIPKESINKISLLMMYFIMPDEKLDDSVSVPWLTTASELVAIAAHVGLIWVEKKPTGLYVECALKIPYNLRQFIGGMKYLPPMCIKPLKITHSGESGLLSEAFDSVILKSFNHGKHEVNLDYINKMNKIELCLSKRALMVEEPLDKDKYETMAERRQAEVFLVDSEAVYKEIVDSGNSFWFRWKYDARGRSYSQGYHVNIQSNSYKKSLIRLKNKEVVSIPSYVGVRKVDRGFIAVVKGKTVGKSRCPTKCAGLRNSYIEENDVIGVRKCKL